MIALNPKKIFVMCGIKNSIPVFRFIHELFQFIALKKTNINKIKKYKSFCRFRCGKLAEKE